MAKGISPELQEYVSKLSNPRLFLRGWLVLAGLEFGALLLGFAFFVIIHGVIFGVAWLMLYWRPAFLAYTKAMGIRDVEFIKLPIRWWQAILLVIKIGFVLFFFYFGTNLLFIRGFLGQNLLYALLSH
ncbi:MAG: hypothetical protein WAV05_16010 [Anaerolineales bacterium]